MTAANDVGLAIFKPATRLDFMEVARETCTPPSIAPDPKLSYHPYARPKHRGDRVERDGDPLGGSHRAGLRVVDGGES